MKTKRHGGSNKTVQWWADFQRTGFSRFLRVRKSHITFKNLGGLRARRSRSQRDVYYRNQSKNSVVNEFGKEAIVAILGPGDFFGEGCLADQPVRMGTATALIPDNIVRHSKKRVDVLIHSDRAFSDLLPFRMLSFSQLRTEGGDLIDQLFNNSEKRLARALLRLTGYGKQEPPEEALPEMSQEMLSEMVGTTRSRVNSFMGKLRKLGYIEYEDGLHIKPSLMNVLQE